MSYRTFVHVYIYTSEYILFAVDKRVSVRIWRTEVVMQLSLDFDLKMHTHRND